MDLRRVAKRTSKFERQLASPFGQGFNFLLKGKKFFLWININNYTVPYERDGREVCFVICSWDLNELTTR